MWYMRVNKDGVIGRRGRPLWSFFASSDLSPRRTYVSLGMSRINGLEDLEKANAGQVGFNGFVLELFSAEEADELA